MGYTIDQLAGKEAVLGSEVIPVHEGTTNKAPVSLLDQGIVITEGGGTNTGIIRKNKSYVLMNDNSDISLNLGEVLGKKKKPDNTYIDDAESGAGIIVTILNASARAHYVVSGSEGYKLEPTQSVQLLWSGTKFVRLLPEFLNDYPKTTDIEANYYNKQTVDTLIENKKVHTYTVTLVVSNYVGKIFSSDLGNRDLRNCMIQVLAPTYDSKRRFQIDAISSDQIYVFYFYKDSASSNEVLTQNATIPNVRVLVYD